MRNAESVPLTVGIAKAPAVVLPSTAPPFQICAVPVQKHAADTNNQSAAIPLARHCGHGDWVSSVGRRDARGSAGGNTRQ